MGGRVLLAVLACAAAAAGSARAATDPTANLLAPAGVCGAAADELGLDQASAEQAMLCLTNYARAQAGLAPLTANAVLDQAGAAKLQADLSCAEFSHTPCGNPFESVFATYLAGATSYQIGENIAWGTGSYGTARQTMDGWLNSPGHRENILTPEFRELGIGYAANQTFQGYGGATLWSQEFGTRAPALTPQTQAATSPASTGRPATARPAQPAAAAQPHRRSRPHRRAARVPRRG